jgi:PAS domain-containing protein
MMTAVATIALGLGVLIGERQSRVSIPFFVMTLTAFLWLSGYSVMYAAENKAAGIFWGMIGQAGIIFIPAAVYHFTVSTLDIYRRHKGRVWLAWLVSAGFLAIAGSSRSFVDGVYSYGWGYYPRYGRMGHLFLPFFFGLMVLSLRHFWVEYQTAPSNSGKKLRSKAFFKAFCIAYLGSIDFLPSLGFPLYPWGYIPVLAFIALTAQTISRHRLVDITPAFAAKEIINAVDDALLILDSEGIVRVANRAACALFGCSENDLVHLAERPSRLFGCQRFFLRCGRLFEAAHCVCLSDSKHHPAKEGGGRNSASH